MVKNENETLTNLTNEDCRLHLGASWIADLIILLDYFCFINISVH